MKNFTLSVLKLYKLNPVVIAFIGGAIISVAINLLTGINSYSGYIKWVVLVDSFILLIDSVLLLIWQNVTSDIQESYKSWQTLVIENNKFFNNNKQTDLISFIKECDNNNNNKEKNNSDLKNNEQSYKANSNNYSIARLALYPILSIILLLIGIALMIWTFV